MLTFADTPPTVADGRLLFAAMDGNSPVHVSVGILLWERLRAEAPWPATDEDQRDHALGMLETMAAAVSPSDPADRLILLD